VWGRRAVRDWGLGGEMPLPAHTSRTTRAVAHVPVMPHRGPQGSGKVEFLQLKSAREAASVATRPSRGVSSASQRPFAPRRFRLERIRTIYDFMSRQAL